MAVILPPEPVALGHAQGMLAWAGIHNNLATFILDASAEERSSSSASDYELKPEKEPPSEGCRVSENK